MMPARPAPLRQSDLTSIAKAMTKARVATWQVRVDRATGDIIVLVGGQPPAPTATGWEDLE